MKNRTLLFAGGLIGLVLAGAVAWYLGSPLFLNRTVDEAFPIESASKEARAAESMAEDSASGEAMAGEVKEGEAMADSGMEGEAKEGEAMDGEAMAGEVMEASDQAAAAEPALLRQGQFKDADSFHQGSGSAAIYELPDGALVLRFENFTVTNGPDLHVLLATNPAPTGRADLGDHLDLGMLKGNIGNQNYDIPAGVDLSQYQSVVIYCMPFHVVFSTATLG